MSYCKGKVAVVTGAGGTLCAPIAVDLAKKGAKVVLVGRGADKLEKVAAAVAAAGGASRVEPADVTDETAIRAIADRVDAEWGPCRILVNGAGGNNVKAMPTRLRFSEADFSPTADFAKDRGFFDIDMDAFKSVLEINRKGLLRADSKKKVVAVKLAYGAVGNVASVFDDMLVRVADSTFFANDATLATYEYRRADGTRLFAFWSCAERMKRVGKAAGNLGGGAYEPDYARPGDSLETRPVAFYAKGEPLKDPVWVDLLSGRVYAFPKDRQVVTEDGIAFIRVPVYDSPCLLTERSAVIP